VYRPVRCLFEFALLQMYRILDVHLLLYSCAPGQGRLNRTERTISHWSINRDLKRVIHITRHNHAFDSLVIIVKVSPVTSLEIACFHGLYKRFHFPDNIEEIHTR
jgi:hypothetical protein